MSPWLPCVPINILALFRKFLHGFAVEERPRNGFSFPESLGVPTSTCVTHRAHQNSSIFCISFDSSALIYPPCAQEALPSASNHWQPLALILSVYTVFFSPTAFAIVCSLLKLLCSYSLTHSFDKYSVRASFCGVRRIVDSEFASSW